MTAEKAAIRATALHEVGVAVDDRLEAAKREQQQLLGQKAAFATGLKLVHQLMAAVDAEIADGKLDLPQGELAKRWVARAGGVLQNLGLRADGLLLTGQGRVEELTALVADLKRRHGAEEARANAPQEAPEARQVGQHPGPTLKEERAVEPDPGAPGGHVELRPLRPVLEEARTPGARARLAEIAREQAAKAKPRKRKR